MLKFKRVCIDFNNFAALKSVSEFYAINIAVDCRFDAPGLLNKVLFNANGIESIQKNILFVLFVELQFVTPIIDCRLKYLTEKTLIFNHFLLEG